MTRRIQASFVICLIAWAGVQRSEAQATREAGDQKAQDTPWVGSVHVGAYETLGTKAKLKLWLARYTVPIVYASIDVAYVFEQNAFCRDGVRPDLASFYSPEFGLARKTGEHYEVVAILQMGKIDYCTEKESETPFVITKKKLGAQPLAIAVNWKDGEIVPGHSGAETSPSSSPGEPKPIPQDADPSALNKAFLVSFGKELKEQGVELSFGTKSPPPSPPVAVGTIVQPFYVPAPPAAVEYGRSSRSTTTYNTSYCFGQQGKQQRCSPNFQPIMRSIGGVATSLDRRKDPRYDFARRSLDSLSIARSQAWQLKVYNAEARGLPVGRPTSP